MKTIRLVAACVFTVMAGSASAAVAVATSQVNFLTASGSAFAQSYWVTPTQNNGLDLTVSGAWDQFSSLSFEISSGPAVIATNKFDLVWLARFNDAATTTYASGFSLTADTPYLLTVSGTTNVLPASLINGSVTVVAKYGSLADVAATPAIAITTPVPEPETYAMMLAGLGLVGAVVRRRRTATAA